MPYRAPIDQIVEWASGEKISGVCAILDGVLIGWIMPAEFTGTTLTFRVCHQAQGLDGPKHGQDETSYDNTPTTEGTFSGGSGHAGTDVLTMSDGTLVTVDAVAAGVVTEFTVDSKGSGGCKAGQTLTQVSSTGSGTGFTLTPDTDNIEQGKFPVLTDSEGNVPAVTVGKSVAYTLVGSEADCLGPWAFCKFESNAAQTADRELITVSK
jgi:hypothetical protein